MSTLQQQHRDFQTRPPIIPAFLFLSAGVSWFYLEFKAIQSHSLDAPYDFSSHSITQLATDQGEINPLTDQNVQSTGANTQNLNFMLNGGLFVAGHLTLLSASTSASQRFSALKLWRMGLAVAYAVGMVLMGQLRGGPMEVGWSLSGWHWGGFALAGVAGNVNAVLAGAVPNVTGTFRAGSLYRLASVLLGLAGLYCFSQFRMLGPWDEGAKIGLWQRGTVYSVLVWEIVSAVALLVRWRVDFSKEKLI